MMSKEKKPIVFVDMDDTLCEFKQACKEHIEKVPSIRIPWCKMDFFRKLKPIEGAIDGVKTLTEDWDVWILTRPSVPNPFSYTEKRLWVEDHLGYEWCEKLILCPNKILMKGDRLVDDTPWPGFEGKQLVFGSVNCMDWESVVKQSKLIYHNFK